jgi:hypothetical protein
MIRSLDDLIAFSEREATTEPLFAEDIRLREPGLPDDEVARLRTLLPRLPDDYLTIVARLDLTTASIGYFNLQPSALVGSGFVDHLVSANSPSSAFWPVLARHRLVHIADTDLDPLCVAAIDAVRPGEVVRIDHEGLDEDRGISPVAPSFEAFLLAAGRLDELRAQGDLGPAAQERFIATLADLRIGGDALRNWRWFAEVALGASDVDDA